MDMAVHWGVLRHLRKEIGANAAILVTAIMLDVIVLTALLYVKSKSDPTLLVISAIGLVAIFAGEKWFLSWKNSDKSGTAHEHVAHTAS